MEWLWGLAFLPALLCGLMCLGGVVLATLGLRQANARRACCDEGHAAAPDREDEVIVDR